MKITKFVHSCLLVETPGRTALFDPGRYSEAAFNKAELKRLDDIFITHEHGDHLSLELIKQLAQSFPGVRITSTRSVADQLAAGGVSADTQPPTGAALLEAPHEDVRPGGAIPQATGFHYLDWLTHPGDSHSFRETKAVLALPVSAPWGSSWQGVRLALKLKPSYVLPIHDWHWHEEARQLMYDRFEQVFADSGIQFFKLETGQPVNIEL